MENKGLILLKMGCFFYGSKLLLQSEFIRQMGLSNSLSAGMAELADALDLGSSVRDVQVQVLLPALIKEQRKCNKKS